MQTALSIAGSDPTGGAGLQSDLQVFRSFGLHGAGVITALTIQDSERVHQSLPVFPSVVLDQLRILLRDQRPAALKLGMLATDDVTRQVALGLELLEGSVPVVIDPILEASDGTVLLERRAWGSLCELIEGCALVTPNLHEAESLSGCDTSTRAGAERAARYFLGELGAKAVLVKGGHREADSDDLLALRDDDGIQLEWLEGERIDSGPVHGTGCALSAAITAGLALDQPLRQAVVEARAFVARGLRNARPFGSGAHFLVYP